MRGAKLRNPLSRDHSRPHPFVLLPVQFKVTFTNVIRFVNIIKILVAQIPTEKFIALVIPCILYAFFIYL